MEIKIDQYTVLQLQEYKGTYQIVEGWDGRDGFKPNFCKREMGPKGAKVEKTLPVNVKLGDKQTAIGALQGFVAYLRGATPEAHEGKETSADTDVPF